MIADLKLAKAMGAQNLKVTSDLQLVVIQVTSDYGNHECQYGNHVARRLLAIKIRRLDYY